MPICDRCDTDTLGTIMSKFNTEMICLECDRKERAHPDYQRAVDADIAEIRKGNTDFKGIGKPEDL